MSVRGGVLIVFLLCAATVAHVVERALSSEAFAATPVDPLEHLLGSSKEIVGDMMFLKADEYFHGGVAEKFNESEVSVHQEGLVDEESHADKDSAGLQDKDWISEINRRIHSAEHFHLSKEKRKEMLPFFALATALDPHNLEAVLSSAYWLDADFNKTDSAIEVLKKGILQNPDSWELEDSLAMMLFKRKKDYVSSREHHKEALRKAQGKELQGYEWERMYFYLAEACLQLQAKTEALSAYQRALAYAQRQGSGLESIIQQKINQLV